MESQIPINKIISGLYNPSMLVSFYRRDFRHLSGSNILDQPIQAVRMDIKSIPESLDPSIDLRKSVQYTPEGLHIEFTRPYKDNQLPDPQKIEGIVGVFAVLPLWSEALRKLPYFVLVARFRNPELKENSNNSLVTFAPGVAMKLDTPTKSKPYGATSKFHYKYPNSSSNFKSSDIEQELNILGISDSDNIILHDSESARLCDESEIFTVAFCMERYESLQFTKPTTVVPKIHLKAGIHLIPSYSTCKNYITEFKEYVIPIESKITEFWVGLGTASNETSETYRVSVDILDFEVFVKSEFIEENLADYEKAQSVVQAPGINPIEEL